MNREIRLYGYLGFGKFFPPIPDERLAHPKGPKLVQSREPAFENRLAVGNRDITETQGNAFQKTLYKPAFHTLEGIRVRRGNRITPAPVPIVLREVAVATPSLILSVLKFGFLWN